jgi:hypothetical protein
MNTIKEDEVVLKEGDLYIALNVVTNHRRIINIDKNIIESMQIKSKQESKRILKG